MAQPTFAVNGGTNLPGIEARWERVVKRKNVDGSIDYQPWALHIWEARIMTMSEFETLQALAGDVLTSLDTTDIDDRNNGTQYTSVEVSLVNCRHQAIQALDVRIEFRVDVT